MTEHDQTDWRVGMKVIHPDIHEPQANREARVLRRLSSWLAINSKDIDDKVLGKCEKAINVRMLDIMDEVRDAPTP